MKGDELPGNPGDVLWQLVILTDVPGERIECCLPARTSAEAIRRLLRRAMFRERVAVTSINASRAPELSEFP